MKHQWVSWIVSGVLTCLTMLAVVASGASEQPFNQIKSAVGLPQTEASAQEALVPSRDRGAPQDFVYTAAETLAQSAPAYQPREEIAYADPTNYGERYLVDAYGQPVGNEFIVVIHETVGSIMSAINTFQTHHPRDEDQVSYHTLIAQDGTVVYVVPPEMRAFGAGDSVFNGPNGPESVTTNSAFPSSVNNFAYHVSLESPADGRDNRFAHSGYTAAQYQSLAWLLARTNIPDSRITTHQAVDRSGSRQDPRSFNGDYFLSLLHQYPSRQALGG
ncbi:MAG: N-acetylmuramoyl-L-alanine amidase [Leptolyngbya sp. SIO4C1]|nr:N-acetylmuramoyl-L-alanine amidase [Leptolyngbya sp. SIO4C1]